MANKCSVELITEVNDGAVIRKPGSSKENKTGSWRTFRPVPDDKKCTGCTICTWYCPENCISMVEKGGKKKAVVDYDYCKGCMICVNECPVNAYRAEKDSGKGPGKGDGSTGKGEE